MVDERQVLATIEFLRNLDGKTFRSLRLLWGLGTILCCYWSIPVLLRRDSILLKHAGLLLVDVDQFHFVFFGIVGVLLLERAAWRVRVVKCELLGGCDVCVSSFLLVGLRELHIHLRSLVKAYARISWSIRVFGEEDLPIDVFLLLRLLHGVEVIGVVSESGFEKIAISFVIRRLTLAIWSNAEIQTYEADALVHLVLGLKWLEFVVSVVVVASVFWTRFVQVKLPDIVGLVEVLLMQINGFCFIELVLFQLLLSGWWKRHFLSGVLTILLANESTKWTCYGVSHLVIWINCAIIWNLVQHRFLVWIIGDGVNVRWAGCFLSHSIDGSWHLVEDGALARVVIILAEWTHLMMILRIVGDREKLLDRLFGSTLGNQAIVKKRYLWLAQLEQVAVSALVTPWASIASVPLLRTPRSFKCLDHGVLLDIVLFFWFRQPVIIFLIIFVGTYEVLVLNVRDDLGITIRIRFLTAIEAGVRLVGVIVNLRRRLGVNSLQDLIHTTYFWFGHWFLRRWSAIWRINILSISIFLLTKIIEQRRGHSVVTEVIIIGIHLAILGTMSLGLLPKFVTGKLGISAGGIIELVLLFTINTAFLEP